jgi:hypothetical protein
MVWIIRQCLYTFLAQYIVALSPFFVKLFLSVLVFRLFVLHQTIHLIQPIRIRF